jgi:pilus assembly protein Flp/PilA
MLFKCLSIFDAAAYSARCLNWLVKVMAQFIRTEQVVLAGETEMISTFSKLMKNEDGATAIEYGLIAALIAVAAIAAFKLVGTNLSSIFNTVASDL